MEVEPLNIPAAQLPTSQRVYALQGVNAATEFLAIQLLQQQAPESAADHPLLRALLRRPEGGTPSPRTPPPCLRALTRTHDLYSDTTSGGRGGRGLG